MGATAKAKNGAAKAAAATPAAVTKRKIRKRCGGGYRDVEVVVHTATEAQVSKEKNLHAMFTDKHKKEDKEGEWGTAAWAAWSASNLMGDVLLKIDDMTRANE